MSVAVNGMWAGQTFRAVVDALGPRLLGTRPHASRDGRFPLLIKLIDSRQRLSVQVHPDNASAARFGGEPKTEMWYILDADPGAGVFAGLRRGTDETSFREAIAAHAFDDLLVTVPVERGEAVFTPGGRVHAIDAGCLILEVQQNSNTTYRIYDWERVGPDGRPRDLHIEEAMRVIRWDDPEPAKVTPQYLGARGKSEHWRILSCPYFCLERLLLGEDWSEVCDGSSFHVLFGAEGRAVIDANGIQEGLGPGETCLIPAALPAYRLLPDEEGATVLRVTVP
jgi:mannose-6-phosphate isomerase